MKLATGILLALLLPLAWPLHANDGSTAAVRYRVGYLGDGRFQVDAEFDRPVSRLDLNSHGAVGRPDGQAASVRSLQAFDAQGRPVPIDFTGEGTWHVRGSTAGRIHYELLADHDAVAWRAGKEEVASRFDNTYYFVGDAFFLVDYDWPTGPIDIAFDLPADWRVIAPWSCAGSRCVANGPEALGSNAFAMGTDAARETRSGNLRLTWLADSRVAAATAMLQPLFDRLPTAYSEFWGGTPGDRLNVYVLSDTMTDGGAFKNSFAMRLDTPLRDGERPIWMHTMAHELMHIWMNQSSDGIGRAPGGSHYWFTEGFTDYLTIKLMRQAGLIDRDMAAQRIANLIRRYELGRRFSPGTRLADAGEKKLDNWELIYGGGAVMALLLDAELSQQSPNAFRDMLRRLQHQGGKPLDGDGILVLMDEGSGGRASALLREIDAGMSLGAIRARMAASGVMVEGYASDEVYVTFADCNGPVCADMLWQERQAR